MHTKLTCWLLPRSSAAAPQCERSAGLDHAYLRSGSFLKRLLALFRCAAFGGSGLGRLREQRMTMAAASEVGETEKAK